MGNTPSLHLRVRRRRIEDSTAVEYLYTKPSGLYPTCAWDPKYVRRLILRGELAPRYPGRDDPDLDAREECPICMLVYPVLNETRCCSARICTECYLQIRPPRHNKEPCPFCKYKRVAASYKGPRDQSDIEREEKDEKLALEAMKRATLLAISTQSTPIEEPNLNPSTTLPSQRTHSLHDAHSEPALSSPSMTCHSNASQITDPRPHCPCACKGLDRLACCEDHRARYFHPAKVPAMDPLFQEAMSSEVTYPATCHTERASASSSSLLDTKPLTFSDVLHPCAEREREPYAMYAMSSADGDNGGPSGSDTAFHQDGHLSHDDSVSLHEALCRSLIDM